MADYVVVISGMAHDYAAGFEYDVNEAHIVSGKTVLEAYDEAKKTLKSIEGKLHIPDLKISRLAPMREDVCLGTYFA